MAIGRDINSCQVPFGSQSQIRILLTACPTSPAPSHRASAFSPYLTLYPLPSEMYYVVARTWQDLEAPRAGCVRTRSVLIPMSEWQEAQNLASIVAMATEAGADKPAERRAPAVPPSPPSAGRTAAGHRTDRSTVSRGARADSRV